MTDYTKLIESLRELADRECYPDDKMLTDAANALEKNYAELDNQSMQLAHDAVTIGCLNDKVMALQAENERLTQDRDEWRDSTIAANANAASEEKRRRDMQEQRDQLQAKLDAIQKQEPRFWYDEDTGELYASANNHFVDRWTALYAAPKALAPEKGTELFDAWCDKSYADGMLLGWNLCESNHPETFQQLRSTRTEAALKVILANRAAHGIGGTP